jgi:glycosyltransferase 2 family protein
MEIPPVRAATGTRTRIVTGLVYALSIGCLLWVYHDFEWRTELPRLARIHWAWIAVAVVSDVLVYVCQAWRWNILMEPVGRIPLGRSVRAVYIGLFANEILPFRSGELIRCYLQAIWSKLPFTLVLSSALIERLIDGVWLIAGFALIALFINVPAQLDAAAIALTILVGVIGALVLFAVLNRRFARHVTTGHRWSDVLRTLVEGLHAMGRSESFLRAVIASFTYLFLQILPIHAMLEGYGLDLPWTSAAIVLVILRLGTVVPALPGNVGVFHFFGFMALTRLLGVEAQAAKGVTAVMFFVITVPLLIGGSIALMVTGLNIQHVLHRAHEHRRQHTRDKALQGK